MKIISRAEFMNLPIGTIYAKGKPCYFGTAMIKGETLFHRGEASDFYYMDIGQFEDADGKDFGDTFDLMVETGISRPLNETGARDGAFDKEDLFLIFEPADLESLIEHARNAIEVAKMTA